MPGSDGERPFLDARQNELLDGARRATLATIGPHGRPRLVPCCFATVAGEAGPGRSLVLYVPLDEKPKRSADPRDLARVRDLDTDPRVALLIDRWSEDWSRLEWLRLEGTASLLEPGSHASREHSEAVAALRGRYPQYREQDLPARPMIRIDVGRVTGWRADG